MMPDADLHLRHLRSDPWISSPAVVAWLLLALSDCTSIAPQPTDPVAVAISAVWSVAPASATTSPTVLAQWWSHFNDPLLSRLVDQALQANLSIKTTEAALREARALRDVTAAALWPTVDGSGLAQRSRADNHSANRFKVGLDASWELDFSALTGAPWPPVAATVQASAASLGDVQVSMAAEVALTYIALRGAQTLLAIANDNLTSQLDILHPAITCDSSKI